MKVKMRTEQEIEITPEDFRAYEVVRHSGVTNMWAVRTVSDLSGLSVEKVKAIISNYEQLIADETFAKIREETR